MVFLFTKTKIKKNKLDSIGKKLNQEDTDIWAFIYNENITFLTTRSMSAPSLRPRVDIHVHWGEEDPA